MSKLTSLLRPELENLEEYVPIQPFEVLTKRLGLSPADIIKLDANENPYGPSPVVVEALAEYSYYHIYPDPQQAQLRAAIGDYVDVNPEQILPSHGADELLDLICRLFLGVNDSIVNCPPTFGMYSFDAKLQGASVIDVPRLPAHGVDVEAITALFESGEPARCATPKLIFLTSPNNPSGTWLPDSDLRKLLELPAIVVLDEAYVEFAEHKSRCNWIGRHDNLIVLRTFSKAAGIAGLRLGYGVFPTWLMPHLWKFKQPYNVNVAATVAGLACLRERQHMEETVAKLRAGRRQLFSALKDIPYLHPVESQANFILCEVTGGSGMALKEALEARGILVRYYDKPGLENCVRISVGTPPQIERVIEELQQLTEIIA